MHTIAPPASKAEFFEIKPALLNLVMREQFSGVSSDDAAAHLNNFVELCEMQKYKDIDGDTIKLKLFPFSLRGRAKEWLLSLSRNSIDSCTSGTRLIGGMPLCGTPVTHAPQKRFSGAPHQCATNIWGAHN